MQANNEQAARTKHARRGISATAGVSPTAVTVCAPWQGLSPGGDSSGALLGGHSQGCPCPWQQPPGSAPEPQTREQLQPLGALSSARECLALALGQNHSGTALAGATWTGTWKAAAARGCRALPGKGTAPTTPQPGLGLRQTLPVQEGTLLCLHIWQQHRFYLGTNKVLQKLFQVCNPAGSSSSCNIVALGFGVFHAITFVLVPKLSNGEWWNSFPSPSEPDFLVNMPIQQSFGVIRGGRWSPNNQGDNMRSS